MKSKQIGRIGASIRHLPWRRFLRTGVAMSVRYVLARALGYLAFILISYDNLLAKGGAVTAGILSVILFGSTWFLLRNQAIIHIPMDRLHDNTAAGEQIADLLKQLPAGYKVFHDVPCRYGDERRDIAKIDHLVIGPGGIFVIEIKPHKGKVLVSEEEQVMLNGKLFERRPTAQFAAQIDRLKRLFETDTEAPFINGHIVFTRATVMIRKPVNGLYYMNQDYLLQHITNQEWIKSWSEEEVQRWHRILEENDSHLS